MNRSLYGERDYAFPLVEVAVEQTRVADRVGDPPAGGEPRVDWGDALDVP